MPTRRKTRAQAEAVVLADALGSSDAAAKTLGLSGRSIRRWRNDPELSELVRKTREDTADDVKVAMTLAWELIIERLQAGQIATRDLIVLGGVAFDKHQLATGGATMRSENRELNDLPDSAYVDAIREARSLLSGTSADEEVAEPAEG